MSKIHHTEGTKGDIYYGGGYRKYENREQHRINYLEYYNKTNGKGKPNLWTEKNIRRYGKQPPKPLTQEQVARFVMINREVKKKQRKAQLREELKQGT